MANVIINDASLHDIADAIRSKNGTENTYKPSQMAEAIEAISGGGITPSGTIQITANGTHNVTNYASAEVNVPTGSEPSLGTKSITANGTYTASSDSLDGYSEVTVNVPTGITPTGTKQISITENGTTTEDVTNYASAEITVNVPSSGSAMASGTYSGSGNSVTLSVDSLYSHIYIYASTPQSDDDISGAPYGGNKLISFFGDSNNGFYLASATTSAGTAWQGGAGGIGRWGGNTAWTNRVEFTASTIKIINPNIGGAGKTIIEGETYNWIAW